MQAPRASSAAVYILRSLSFLSSCQSSCQSSDTEMVCGAGAGTTSTGKRRRLVEPAKHGPKRLELGGGRAICAVPFLAPEACREFVALCEAHAAERGGWSKELAVRYPQTTTDLEVDRAPALRRWLLGAGVMIRVGAHFAAAHGAQLHALDDLFVIKYDARKGGEQRELRPHRDAGDLSFMVALSARSEYTGGGTHYPELQKVVHLEQGELLSFDADLVHSGVPISSGVRYLLVGFCHCGSPAAATEPGNISCETLEMIVDNTLDDLACGQRVVVSEPVAVVRQCALGAAAVSTLRADALKLHAIASEDDAASYWMDATATPRCSIEQFALEVLAMHIPTAVGAADAGAEYWVQRLDRCPAHDMDRDRGRDRDSTSAQEERRRDCGAKVAAAEHLPFHFDKDEAALRDGGVWRHPACATVSYLSAAKHGDLPTVIFDSVVQEQAAVGDGSAAVQPRQACISYPSEGKHLAFRGKHLHGCPLELAYSQRQTRRREISARQGVDSDGVGRLTLLVNLWTKGTRPASLRPLPTKAAVQLAACSDWNAQQALLKLGEQPEQVCVPPRALTV